MLRDIEKAINKVLAGLDVKVETNNESIDNREVLATILAVEVFRDITSDTSQPTPTSRGRGRRKPPEPANDGGVPS